MTAASAGMLAGCGQDATTTTTIDRTLTVIGTPADIARFAARQPALSIVRPGPSKGAEAEAAVTIPQDFTGRDIVRTTRAMVDAGLGYRARSTKTVTTSPSWKLSVNVDPSLQEVASPGPPLD